jgi:hypothetical protein
MDLSSYKKMKFQDTTANELRHQLTGLSIGERYFAEASPRTSFLEILQDIDPESAEILTKSMERYEGLERLGHTPILGVCGMQNSGKSTLVAHHLSSAGRKRVLVGDFSEEGTHRFVFWAPQSWEADAERKNALEQFIGNAFGGIPELLSADPAKAAEQYNARTARTEEFGVPILAFDPALDDLGIAILDCPDIQRSFDSNSKEPTAHLRRIALGKASRLCSCFFVVSEVTQQEDEKLRAIFDAIEAEQTGLPVFYVCTKVHRARMDSVYADVLDRLDSIRVRDKVRSFFASPRLETAPETGYPRGVEYRNLQEKGQSIEALCNGLEASRLQSLFLADLQDKIAADFSNGEGELRAHDGFNQQIIQDVRKTLLKFLDNEFHRGESGLSPFYTKEIVSTIMDSLARTAPWYLKPSMWVPGVFRWTMGVLKKGKDRIASSILKRQKKERSKIEKSKHIKKVKSKNFALCFEGRSYIPAVVDEAQLEEIWESSVSALGEQDVHQADELRIDLDEKMKAVWKEVPFRKKALAGRNLLVVLAGGLLAALLLPLDGGGSFAVYAVTVKELMLAVGLSGLAGTEAAFALSKTIEDYAARPQHSAILAMLQDKMGVPRASTAELQAMPENKKIELNDSDIPRKDALIHVLKEPVILLDEDALAAIKETVQSDEEGKAPL